MSNIKRPIGRGKISPIAERAAAASESELTLGLYLRIDSSYDVESTDIEASKLILSSSPRYSELKIRSFMTFDVAPFADEQSLALNCNLALDERH